MSKRWILVSLFLLLMPLLSTTAAAQRYGWVAVSNQTYRLEPGRWQAAGTFGPGDIDLRIRVQAENAVSLGLMPADDWEEADRNGRRTRPTACKADALVNSVFTCRLEDQEQAMVLVVQDHRTVGDAIGAVLAHGARRGAEEIVSSNHVRLTRLRWACTSNCFPSYKWVNVSKEKFQLFAIGKTYGPITPEHEGNQVRVKLKAPVPMLLAILPVAEADRLRAHPAEAEDLLAGAPCKQRAVQKADFTCRVSPEDGTHQVVLMPEPGLAVRGNKKAEVHVTQVRCVANCQLR